MKTNDLYAALVNIDGRKRVVVDTGDVSDIEIYSVKEEEKKVTLVCRTEENMARQILDAYFQTRLPLAFDAVTPPERKTTLEIQDDLRDMYEVSQGDITKYLLSHAYTMATEENGTLSWRIWRRFDVNYDI